MKKIILTSLIVLTFAPLFAQADPATRVPEPRGEVSTRVTVSIPNPVDGVSSLTDLFYKVINFIISFSYVVIAFFLILSGFKFVMAQGSEDKLKDAKTSFKYTIIGAILVIGAQTIIEVVRSIITRVGGP